MREEEVSEDTGLIEDSGNMWTRFMKVDCETESEGCLDTSDMGLSENEIIEKFRILERYNQIRIEEDARMAERFENIKEQLKSQQGTLSKIEDQLDHVDKMTSQNNHDLNNGLKSAVAKNSERISRVERALLKHLNTTPTDEERINEIERIHSNIDERAQEKTSKTKHRTIEKWAALIGITIALEQFGFIDWLFTLIGGLF